MDSRLAVRTDGQERSSRPAVRGKDHRPNRGRDTICRLKTFESIRRRSAQAASTAAGNSFVAPPQHNLLLLQQYAS